VDKIEYIDHPDLNINKNESTQMPFRYVKGDDGEPIMPKVRVISRGVFRKCNCVDYMYRVCVI